MNAVIAQPTRDFLNLGFKPDSLFPQASSHKVFPSRHISWKIGSKLGHFITRNHVNAPKDRFISLRCKSCLRIGAPFVLGPKRKLLKLSAFKSNRQNDDSGGRPTGSKSLKNSIGFSYIPQETEASLTESAKPQSVPTSSYTSEAETTPGSLAIQNLFKSWLMLVRMPSPNHSVDETVEEPSSIETSETQSSVERKEKFHILKAVWCFFWGLDVTIKIPLLIFIPLYLAVNLKYGAEVSRELTPLWLLGPIIAALYTKLFRGIGALYAFSFWQTVKVISNLPTYSLVAYNYIFRGKLNEIVRRHLIQPLVDMKNLDYKEESKRKLKELEVFLLEKYLDFVESIWPYYCRTIRFLKKANLI